MQDRRISLPLKGTQVGIFVRTYPEHFGIPNYRWRFINNSRSYVCANVFQAFTALSVVRNES